MPVMSAAAELWSGFFDCTETDTRAPARSSATCSGISSPGAGSESSAFRVAASVSSPISNEREVPAQLVDGLVELLRGGEILGCTAGYCPGQDGGSDCEGLAYGGNGCLRRVERRLSAAGDVVVGL